VEQQGFDKRQHDSPARNADELAALAAKSQDPAARVWYLEWAKAFRRLASLNKSSDRPETKN
jgi:hypothetical protein